MINCIAFDYNLALHDYDYDFFNRFFTLLSEKISNSEFDDSVLEFLKDYLTETQTNSEYISNLMLFYRSLEKTFLESESIKVAKFLQQCSYDFINEVFRRDAINSDFLKLADMSDTKFIYKTLVMEPYFNNEVADKLLNNLHIAKDKIDYMTTNEYSHYGKKNIRFFFELLDKMHIQANPSSLLYITADTDSAQLATKLGMTVFFVTKLTDENTSFKYHGTFSRMLEFVSRLPKAVICRM